MSAALGFAAVSAGLNIVGGLFGFLESLGAAEAAESRASLLRAESEAEAMRYEDQARAFKAEQATAYTKAGVTLEGSPLAVLDETARVAVENISAIRARGAAMAQEELARGAAIEAKGRQALIGGLTGGLDTLATAKNQSAKNAALSRDTGATSPTAFSTRTGFIPNFESTRYPGR